MIDQWYLPWVGKERVETCKPDLYLLYLWFCHLCLLSLYEGLFIALLSSDCLVNRSRIPTPRITEEQTPSYLPFSSGLFALKIYKNFWRPWEFKLRNTKFHPSITSSEGTRQTLKLEYKPSMKADTCLAHWERILSCWSSCFSMPILESFPHPSARPQSLVPCGVGTEFHFQKQAVPLLTNLPLPCAGWYLLNCLAGSPGGLPSCSCSVAKCPTLWPHGLQHARLPCPLPSPGVCPRSCPLNRWCHPTISSFVALFSFCLQCFPASGSFPVSQLFTSGGQSIGASASASVLPMNIQGWFLYDWPVWSSCSPRDSWESSPAPQFFSALPSLWSNSHIHTWPLESLYPWLYRFLSAKWCLCFLTHCLGLSWLSCTEAIVF